jgi:hypothetical protein
MNSGNIVSEGSGLCSMGWLKKNYGCVGGGWFVEYVNFEARWL